ncbi:hypothetical protein [Geoalkalibacter ferrihydriticus]|uniref:hypothetical protein n=1 Tax=Geoalkalibacter ferrihydriticus TaxID=392333 RepID=UPI001427E281|nr:hypothetical protein [Geoalkalibacter ferrihydriticus]
MMRRRSLPFFAAVSGICHETLSHPETHPSRTGQLAEFDGKEGQKAYFAYLKYFVEKRSALARHQAGSDLTDVLSHASSNDPLNHPFLNWKHPDHQIGGFHESPLQNVVANRG